MAMKKDDDKTKKVASVKKKDSLGSPTASGKPAYKIGGDNPLGVRKLNASKPTASISSGPRAVPSRPMGKDVTGERNFDKTPNQAQYNANVAFKEKRMRRQERTAYGVGALGTLAALNFSGDNNYVKQAAKWIKDTPIRKEAKRVQKAENDAMIVERKAKAEAKNPSTPVAKVKASKSTMKNIKRLKKGQ